jgi:mono/diheme cytochrome c family protein
MKKILMSSLLLIASNSLLAEGNHSGGHKNKAAGHGGGHWMAPEEATAIPNPIKFEKVSIERGKKSYDLYCASCHGAKADGNGPAGASLKPKPANLSVMAGMHPDGDFAWKIKNGRGAMPGWKTVLSDNQVWDLVNYIKNLKATGQSKSMMKMGGMMKGMDISKMSLEDMQAFMKKMMPDMDHSALSKEKLQSMMTLMQKNMKGKMPSSGHSNSDGHHQEKPKAEKKADNHDKPHSH